MGRRKYIDRKFTIWDRQWLDDDISDEEIIELIKNGEIYNVNYESESLYDSMEDISVEENDGNPTEEFYDWDGTLIWDNKNGINKNK